jgi:hypothetical protein
MRLDGFATYVNPDDALDGPAVRMPYHNGDSGDSRPYAGNVAGAPDCRT